MFFKLELEVGHEFLLVPDPEPFFLITSERELKKVRGPTP